MNFMQGKLGIKCSHGWMELATMNFVCGIPKKKKKEAYCTYLVAISSHCKVEGFQLELLHLNTWLIIARSNIFV